MKILLVEDDTFFQNFYALKLREAGYEVDAAENGEEGLAKMRSFLPNLILLDLIMPIKDGFQFLEEKKQDPQTVSIPVIVFSTLGQEKDVQKAMSLGAIDFINKTFFDFDNLLAKIRSILQQ